MKKILIIVAGLIFVLSLALSSFIIFGINSSISRNTSIVGYKYDNHENYKIGNAKIDKPITSIDIDWITGNVVIIPADDNVLTIIEESKNVIESDHELRYMVDGSTLYIKYCKSDLKDNNLPIKDLTISIPSEYLLDEIDVDSISSFVKVDGIASRSFECNTISGAIQLSNSDISHKIAIETTSGNIDVDNLSYLDSADISTISGTISIDTKMIYKAEIDTTSGNAFIDVEEEFNEFEFESISGNLDLILPQSLSCTLEFESVSGDFSTNHPASINGKKYVFGTGENDYNIESVSGDVRIR